MMERQQLKLGDKVKMKLVQPAIKCSGRADVTCHYKGKVIDITGPGFPSHYIIQFKRYGETVEAWYDIFGEQFIEPENRDIRIIQEKVCCFD